MGCVGQSCSELLQQQQQQSELLINTFKYTSIFSCISLLLFSANKQTSQLFVLRAAFTKMVKIADLVHKLPADEVRNFTAVTVISQLNLTYTPTVICQPLM
jgi:hypothetical protein